MTETDLIAADNAAASSESPAREPHESRGGALGTMVLPELRALATQVGVKGTSGMRKQELIAAISEIRAGGSHNGGLRDAKSAGQPAGVDRTDAGGEE
ncbi:MAG: transcription termination factor Rho, partial [Mycobacterium sp.]|nr:transcription termination factor Rho [Mycobacterium sp.]